MVGLVDLDGRFGWFWRVVLDDVWGSVLDGFGGRFRWFWHGFDDLGDGRSGIPKVRLWKRGVMGGFGDGSTCFTWKSL